MRLRRLPHVFAFTAGILLLQAMHANAQDAGEIIDQPWRIEADHLMYRRQPEEVEATGNVILSRPDDHTPGSLRLSADRILYQVDKNRVSGRGNLRLQEDYDEIRAEAAMLDLTDRTATFHRAVLFRAENNMYLTSRLLEKTGDRTYRLQDSRFTTCPLTGEKAPPWSIWSRKADLTQGGYARLRHVTFRIRDIPVLYSPYLLVPTRTDKQSGFLFPEYSQSDRHGTGLVAPFFINLAPNADITLYPGFYSSRGGTGGIEARYMLSGGSRGTFVASYLHDTKEDTPADDYKEDGFLRTTSERYWLRGKIDHDFGDKLVGRLDLDLASDRDFLREFRKNMLGFDESNREFYADFRRGFQPETVPRRENTIQFAKLWNSMDLFGEARLIDDLLDETGPTPLWTVPRLAFSGLLPLGDVPADLTWQTEYVHYWRREGTGAHRLDLHPRLGLSLPLSPYLETAAETGIRETIYLVEPHGVESEAVWSDEREKHRTLYDLSLTTATTLARDYESGKWPAPFRHSLRPALGYHYLPRKEQSDLPLLDRNDRVPGRNWLTWTLDNYLLPRPASAPSFFHGNVAALKMSQVYDLDAHEHPLSDLALDLEIRLRERLQFNYETTFSVYGQGLTAYDLEAHYRNRRGDSFSLDWRYRQRPDTEPPSFFSESREESLHEINGRLHTTLNHRLSTSFQIIHSLSEDEIVDSTLSLTYRPSCWSVELTASRTPSDTSLTLIISLAELGKALEVGLPGL